MNDAIPSPYATGPGMAQEPAAPPAEEEHEHWTTTLRALWKDAIVLFLATRVALVLVGLLATFYILPLMASNPVLPPHSVYMRFPQALWLMWQHFDSGFYLYIAQHGYDPASALHGTSNWVFYPLYPLLIAGVGFLLGGQGDAYSIAGLLVSNVAALAGVCYLFLLLRREFGRLVAARTVLYVSLFPLGFYLSAIYTEALFLALCVMSIYYARRQRWWLASLCGGLAALTRAQGLMLIVPVGWEFLRVVSARYAPQPDLSNASFRERARTAIITWLYGLLLAARRITNWLMACSLLLIPAGLLAFLLYARARTGDLLATFHSDQWGWGRQLSYPWRLLIYSLRHPIVGEPLNWNFWVLNIVLAFVFLGFTVWAFRRLPIIYALYTAVMVLLPLSANLLNSLGRFYLTVFPAFLLLALFSRNEKQPIHPIIVGLFAFFQATFMIFFVLGIPAIA